MVPAWSCGTSALAVPQRIKEGDAIDADTGQRVAGDCVDHIWSTSGA